MFQVLHHQKLGQSKEEFLSLNGPQMALSSHVMVVLTEAATTSPFVFHEVLFADWLGKRLVTAMFANTWASVRPSLKAVLGEMSCRDIMLILIKIIMIIIIKIIIIIIIMKKLIIVIIIITIITIIIIIV